MQTMSTRRISSTPGCDSGRVWCLLRLRERENAIALLVSRNGLDNSSSAFLAGHSDELLTYPLWELTASTLSTAGRSFTSVEVWLSSLYLLKGIVCWFVYAWPREEHY